jgi:predicted phage gp36 major capsid-like protein
MSMTNAARYLGLPGMTRRVIVTITMRKARPSRRGAGVAPGRRRQTMATKSETRETQTGAEMFSEMQGKALEAFATLAQTNQRVMQGFVDLSVAAAKEGMRAYADLSAAAVDAARGAQPNAGPSLPTIEEMQSDPFSWYQRGLLTAVDGTQKWFRFLEANAQVVTRSAERLQASAERTGKEIQEALTSYMSRMKEIYARN